MTLHADNAAQIEPACPVCDERLMTDWQGQLYGITVCDSCRLAFARRRYWAFIVDGFALAGLLSAMKLLCTALLQPTAQPVVFAVAYLLQYALFFRDGFRGQSLGKRLFDLRTIDSVTGEGIQFGKSGLRHLPMALSVTIPIMFVQLKTGLRIGDRLARTKVIWQQYRDRPPFIPPVPSCEHCGYNLTANASGRCPECGASAKVVR